MLMNVDSKQLVDIADGMGTPVYVVYEDLLSNAYREFVESFAAAWPKVSVAYSYKTNSLLAVCRVFRDLGSWAEVTSGLELAMAFRLGVPPDHIVFNGPYKTDEELESAIRTGCHVNIDGWNELERAKATASRLGHPVPVGIRINLACNTPRWDKFGFVLESGEARQAIRSVLQSAHLELEGLHLHLGTNVQNAGAYEQAAVLMGQLAAEVAAMGTQIRYLDLGGGFATTSPVPYLVEDWNPASPSEYARAIERGLRQAGVPHDVRLILEPGRIVTANAAVLLTQVVEIKASETRGIIVIVDSGVNLVQGAAQSRYNIRALQETGQESEVDIAGNLCMQADVLAVGVRLPSPKVGSLLAIEGVGAYDIPWSVSFIRPRAPVVMVSQDGREHLIRRRERVEDLWRLEDDHALV